MSDKRGNQNRFKGKVVIVTGGTSGIGKAVAVKLVVEGAKVVITGRDAGKGAMAAKEIDSSGRAVKFVQADVARAVEVERQTKQAIKFFGKLDILVGCAGINVVGKLIDTSESAWDRLMEINARGQFLSIKSVSLS